MGVAQIRHIFVGYLNITRHDIIDANDCTFCRGYGKGRSWDRRCQLYRDRAPMCLEYGPFQR